MNEWEEDIEDIEDIEYEDPVEKIQLEIEECHRRMDAISSYQDECIKPDIDECHRRMDAIVSHQDECIKPDIDECHRRIDKCMKMILDLDYIVCSHRYRSEEMIQTNSMILDSINIRQDMFAELINYLIKHFDLDSEERVLDIEKNYLEEEKNKFDKAKLELEKIDATFQEELNKRKDFRDDFLKTLKKNKNMSKH